MVSHENWDFPENSQNVPKLGLHTSARLETINAGCQSLHVLGWATHPPTAAETQRPSKACAIYHSHTSMFQTHISLIHSQGNKRGATGHSIEP